MKRLLLFMPVILLAIGCQEGGNIPPKATPNLPSRPWFDRLLPQPYIAPEDEYDQSPAYPAHEYERKRRPKERDRINERLHPR